METPLAASLLRPAMQIYDPAADVHTSVHTWDLWKSFFICRPSEKSLSLGSKFTPIVNGSLLRCRIQFRVPRLGSRCAHHHTQEDKTLRLICQTHCKPTEARWRLGVKPEVWRAALRNAPRSACVIINGCQRLFSGRRCWQTALQKHRDCVSASLGWMRELRVLAKRLWQMIQVTKPGQSPSSAAIWGIPGHLYKRWESVNWSVDTSSHSNCDTAMEETNWIYHQPSWSRFTTLGFL